ncbi:MAG: hypothetical protein GF393_05755, partial [Armatimonadia bacterium]|nr:hypothetical protein [Armatimonadia bacterium]
MCRSTLSSGHGAISFVNARPLTSNNVIRPASGSATVISGDRSCCPTWRSAPMDRRIAERWTPRTGRSRNRSARCEMMRTALTAVMMALLCLPIAADANSSLYPCFRAQAAPAIDGDAADACWQHAPLATGFSVLGGGFTDAKQTAFRLCWDDAALYYLIICEEPDVARLKTDVRDGGQGWLNDGVELFVQPGGQGQAYQLVVTAAAARAAGAGAPDWRQVEAAVAQGEASYTLEIAIPHDLVRARPDVGDAWAVAVCRNTWTTNSGGDKFTSWPPLTRQFLEPDSFATIDFRGAAPAQEAVTALTRDLNRDYREHLVGELRAVAERGPIYRPVLE